MDMNTIGILLIIGAGYFIVGAIIGGKFFMGGDRDKMAEKIESDSLSWLLLHVLSLLSMSTLSYALILLANTFTDSNAVLLAVLGISAFIVGSLVWMHITFKFRLGMTPKEYVHTTEGSWTFPVYSVLTLLGLADVG